MGHGHGGEIDFDALLQKEMPAPFCNGNWRRLTAGVGIVSLLVLAYSLEQHFGPGRADAAEGTPKVAPPIAVSAASQPVWAATEGGAAGGVQPVAGTAEGGGTNAAGVRYVAGTGGSAFNTAAATIRPSVVGIRASHAPGAAGGVHRVGSGLIVDPRGYVVTCYHVVGSSPAITVSRFRRSGEQLRARLVARQEDLALLQILEGGPFAAAAFADSNGVSVGDWVLAIGHPFGLGLTVTAGIVGRKNSRLAIPGGGQYADVIQTDAPINEGSSGGPLVDLSGRVVGLNTAIYAPTGVFSGAGFAVPSNRVRDFVARNVPAGGATGGGW